jgi:hypothetical protein
VTLSGRDVGRIPFGGLSSALYWWVSSTLLTAKAQAQLARAEHSLRGLPDVRDIPAHLVAGLART